MGETRALTDELLGDAIAQPSLFADIVLGWTTLTAKQRQIMDAMRHRGAAVSVLTANGVGKTSRIIAGLVLWHLLAFPKGRVVSTSGSYRQVTSQLMPTLRSFAPQFHAWVFQSNTIVTEDGEARYLGFSTKEAGRFEGYHSGDLSKGEDLMIIADEAKTIPDPIFEAVDRCDPARVLLVSSGGFAGGFFHKTQRHPTVSKHYKRFKITADECPWISRKSIAERREKWKGNPALIASMLDAEFIEEIEDCILSAGDVDQCVFNPCSFEFGEEVGFCDFAAGGDENVFAYRQGNKVQIADAWRDKNTSASCGRFIKNFRKFNLKPQQIAGDADGLGIVMINTLRECGWPILPFHGAAAPRLEQYKNTISETWHEGALAIKAGDVILPEDDELRGQLISRMSKTDSRGKLWLESKEDMKSRGLPSPDRADAALGALRKRARGLGQREAKQQLYGKAFLEEGEPEEGQRDHEEVMAGFNV